MSNTIRNHAYDNAFGRAFIEPYGLEECGLYDALAAADIPPSGVHEALDDDRIWQEHHVWHVDGDPVGAIHSSDYH